MSGKHIRLLSYWETEAREKDDEAYRAWCRSQNLEPDEPTSAARFEVSGYPFALEVSVGETTGGDRKHRADR